MGKNRHLNPYYNMFYVNRKQNLFSTISGQSHYVALKMNKIVLKHPKLRSITKKQSKCAAC